jgi:hypothetical protein
MKTHVTVSIDPYILEKVRERGFNMSELAEKAAKEAVNICDTPEAKENVLRQELYLCDEEVKKLTERKQKATMELGNIESEKIAYAEKMKAAAKEKLESRKKKIEQEIKYWPSYIKRGDLSTSHKRENLYKTRAKILGLSLEEYMNEIVVISENMVIL